MTRTRGILSLRYSSAAIRNSDGIVSKFLAFLIIGLLPVTTLNAQVVYYQGFNSTLAASGWTNTNLTTPWASGSFIGLSNNWYVNDAESGMPANTCGAGYAGNPTLYMGAVGLGALGAAYLSNASTNRRISSPNINTTGYSGMTLSFNFIANGYQTTDKAYFQYSIDGGATWIIPAGSPTSTTPALQAGANWSNLKSQVCSPQGRWTNVTWAMPAACENIPNLRIAFVWQNNSATGGNASDPCLAIDEVYITVILSPVRLSAFDAACNGEMHSLSWTTESEQNNDYFEIEVSRDLNSWENIGKVKGAGNANNRNQYSFSFISTEFPNAQYVRLSQTDFDGRHEILKIIAVESCLGNASKILVYPNPAADHIEIIGATDMITQVSLYDLSGRLIFVYDNFPVNSAVIGLVLSDRISSGVYLVRIAGHSGIMVEQRLIIAD